MTNSDGITPASSMIESSQTQIFHDTPVKPDSIVNNESDAQKSLEGSSQESRVELGRTMEGSAEKPLSTTSIVNPITSAMAITDSSPLREVNVESSVSPPHLTENTGIGMHEQTVTLTDQRPVLSSNQPVQMISATSNQPHLDHAASQNAGNDKKNAGIKKPKQTKKSKKAALLKEQATDDKSSAEDKSGSTGLIICVVALFVALGAGGVWFFWMRKRQ